MNAMSPTRTVYWRDARVCMIDQRLLPEREVTLVLDDVAGLAKAIRDMAVRGAPAIGATAAYGLALGAQRSAAATAAGLRADLAVDAETLLAARPTASNLAWALGLVLGRLDTAIAAGEAEPAALRALALAEAERIADEDVATNRRMGALGAALLAERCTVIHHCNTGALATVDYGTALGVIRAAHEQGKRIRVLVDETRPRLQGARLTAWELARLGVPQTLIVDGAAGYYLQRGEVDAVLVGADRIAANGDTANKIGTYPLAVVARENGVPVYVVAPSSTVDLGCASGAEIPIELRDPIEVTEIAGRRIPPAGVLAANPAFDLTPARYISAIVTEAGVLRPPFEAGLRAAVEAAGRPVTVA